MLIKFYARGHPLITATHKTTMEITKDIVKTPHGDCIIATRSELALSDLPIEFKENAKNEKARIGLIIKVNDILEEVWGKGHPLLSFESSKDMVIRKSGYICGRTLMIHADKAAYNLNRDLVNLLKNEKTIIELTLILE
jgi:hypothetical protein